MKKLKIVLALFALITAAHAQETTVITTPANTVTTPSGTMVTTPSGTMVTTPMTTTTTTQRQVIITPTPAVTADKITPAPTGYVHCFNVAAGWYQDTWVAEHQVCQYDTTAASSNPSIQGVAWVAGYWTCPTYNSKGECTNWEWKPGRWVKTMEVY